MPADTGPGEPGWLSPDEAFAVLGNETRLTILQVLGDADAPLAFSDLYDRVEYDSTANFNYHLEKLQGHFVRRTEEGYDLRQAGQRVVEAVLSGAVTDAPEMKSTQVDMGCPLCGAPTAVSYQQERLDMYCTRCSGLFGRVDTIAELSAPPEYGHLGYMTLPPAGIQGRTATETLEAAWAWSQFKFIARGNGMCPRCSAPVERSVTVCENHDDSDGACDRCGRNSAVYLHVRCTNCINDMQGIITGILLGNTDLQAFLTAHGINLVAPDSIDYAFKTIGDFEEEVVTTDPFEARFTFTVDDDAITLTIGEDLSVVDVTRGQTTDAG